MRGLQLAVIAGFAALWCGVLASSCSKDVCLKALSENTATNVVTQDCLSFLQVTTTLSTSTHTTSLGDTATPVAPLLSNGNVTEGIADLHERWQDARQVFGLESHGQTHGLLENRAVDTASRTLPSYVSTPCVSAAAYSSACSCLGLSPMTETITASAALGTGKLFVGNSTIGRWQNGTRTSKMLSTESIRPSTTFDTSASTSRHENSLSLTHSSSNLEHSGTTLSSSSLETKIPQGTSPGKNGFNSTVASHSSFMASSTSQSTLAPFLNLSSPVLQASNTSILLRGSSSVFTQQASPALSPTSSAQVQVVVPMNGTLIAKLNATSTSPTPWLNASTTTSSIPLNTSLLNINATASWVNTATITSFTSKTRPTLWVNSTILVSSPNMTTAPFLNVTSLPTALSNTTTAPFINATSSPMLNISSTSLKANTTSAPFLNTTSVLVLNATISSLKPNVTAPAYLNATSSLLLNVTATMTNATTARWFNSTATSSATPTPTLDLTCGQSTSSFALQISKPGGIIDGYWLHVVGDGILFTAAQAKASQFSVESTGLLCAVGDNDEIGRPRLASVGMLESEGSQTWLLRDAILDTFPGSYSNIKCSKDSTLSCQGGNQSIGTYGTWYGCGLMLNLARSTAGGICSPVTLNIVR